VVERVRTPPTYSGIGKEQARVDLSGAATSADQLCWDNASMGFPSMDALIDLKSEGRIIGGGFELERGL
jgi:hypothetical protein